MTDDARPEPDWITEAEKALVEYVPTDQDRRVFGSEHWRGKMRDAFECERLIQPSS